MPQNTSPTNVIPKLQYRFVWYGWLCTFINISRHCLAGNRACVSVCQSWSKPHWPGTKCVAIPAERCSLKSQRKVTWYNISVRKQSLPTLMKNNGILFSFSSFNPTSSLTFPSLLVTWYTNRFNIQQLYALPTLYLGILYLSQNGDLCHLHHKLNGFYNRDEKCLLRGTDWIFKYSSLRFVFKWSTWFCHMEVYQIHT